jgi:hypothetical protein
MDEERETGVNEMRSLPILIVALTIAVFVPHVCAENVTMYSNNVTYPQEYYDTTAKADATMDRIRGYGNNWAMASFNDRDGAANYRLVAIQIMLEKQNELISEQNTLLGKLLNQTYSVHYSYMSNFQTDTEKGLYTAIPNL